MKLRSILFLFALLFPVALNASSWVELKNDYIRVKVVKDTGRYVVGTVKGDPSNPDDDNKYLTYDDSPPTSFTTIAFGKNGKDAYKYGSGDGDFVKKPVVENNTVVSIWKIKDCWIIQTLSFTNSPTTRRPDSLLVEYKVVNRADVKKKVGIRILVDTCLGEADGTPYFIPGVGKVDDEREFTGTGIPTYWYSFDNLDNPKVRSMGTLKGKTVTTPDRLLFASWKKLDQKPWNYKYDKGSSFRRSLFGARDSAVALYFNSKEITPGYQLRVATLYGMFGTATRRGKVWDIALGGSSQTTSDDVFPITLDMRNSSKLDLIKCKVKLSIPRKVLVPVPDKEGKFQKEEFELEELDGGDSKRYTWYFKARKGVKGEFPYSVQVSGIHKKNAYQASARRTLLINEAVKRAPPTLTMVDVGILDSSVSNTIISNRLPRTNAIKRPVITNVPARTGQEREFPLVRLTHRPPGKAPGYIDLKSPSPVVITRVLTNAPLYLVTTNAGEARGMTNRALAATNSAATNSQDSGVAATNSAATNSQDSGVAATNSAATNSQDSGVAVTNNSPVASTNGTGVLTNNRVIGTTNQPPSGTDSTNAPAGRRDVRSAATGSVAGAGDKKTLSPRQRLLAEEKRLTREIGLINKRIRLYLDGSDTEYTQKQYADDQKKIQKLTAALRAVRVRLKEPGR